MPVGQTVIPGKEPCPACEGTKRVTRTRGVITWTEDCSECGGLGRKWLCANCLEPFPCSGMRPGVLDGQCENPRHPEAPRPGPVTFHKRIEFPKFEVDG